MTVISHLLAQALGTWLEWPMNAWVVEHGKTLPKLITCEQGVLETFSLSKKAF